MLEKGLIRESGSYYRGMNESELWTRERGHIREEVLESCY